MIAQNLVLNMIPDGIRPKVYLSQGDSGTSKLKFHLISEGQYYEIPRGVSAVFLGQNPERRGFSYACTYKGHIVSVDVTEQMSRVPGYTECELRLVDTNDNVIGSVNIDLVVERSPFNNICCSSNDFSSINDAITETARNAAIAQMAAEEFTIDYIVEQKAIRFNLDVNEINEFEEDDS